MNPPSSHSEALTRDFFRWERYGRGWQVFDHPVVPEPPFQPFRGHHSNQSPPIDDGCSPTILSSLLHRVGRVVGVIPLQPGAESVKDELPPPLSFIRKQFVEVEIVPPTEFDSGLEARTQFLQSLSACSEPLAFELIGVSSTIKAQFCLHPRDATLLRQQVNGFFPTVGVVPTADALQTAWNSANGRDVAIVECGLRKEFMSPLAEPDLDLFVALTGALACLRDGEIGVFQVLFQPVRFSWAESILAAVTDNEGGSFFVNASGLVERARHKISRPLYAAVVRFATRSSDPERAAEIAFGLAGALTLLSNPASNELIALSSEKYPLKDREHDLLRRQSRRSGMILNVSELASLVHVPSSEVRSPKLQRQRYTTRTAPIAAQCNHGHFLGHNFHAGTRIPVAVSLEQRVRHSHIIGASGTGKSTLLLNSIIQDIASGQGVAVIDPHGDLIQRILEHIPQQRFRDVILFDPSDEDFPIGFNILSAHSAVEKNLLASDLVSVFRRFATTWGDQMNSVLGNAVLAFLESDRGGTLLDLRRFLIEPEFRKSFLETVGDRDIAYFWQHHYPLLRGNSHASILTRLDEFLRPKLIRSIVAQRVSRFNLASVMDEGKILLVKLAHGAIGQSNAYLLGSLIVAKLHQVVLGRQNQEESRRRPFWLYIDEFHEVVTQSMASILSGARKYRLGLVLAHHDLTQLKSQEAVVASAVLTHPSIRVCFRVNDDDARKLAEGFAHFEAGDLLSLGVGEAICRVERADHDFNLKVPPPPVVDPQTARANREQILALSRANFATPREELEREIASLESRESERAAAKPAVVVDTKREPSPPTDPSILTEMEIRFLKAVVGNPGKPSSTYAKLARVSGQRAVELRQRLVTGGFLREHSVATGNRGAPAVILEPLDPAHSALRKANAT